MEGHTGSPIHWLECPIVLCFTQVKWTVIISPSLDRPHEDAAPTDKGFDQVLSRYCTRSSRYPKKKKASNKHSPMYDKYRNP